MYGFMIQKMRFLSPQLLSGGQCYSKQYQSCEILPFIGVYQNLRITFDPLIELLVCRWSFVNANLMRNDKAWVSSPCNDHVSQIAIILFDVTLACANSKALYE